MAIASAMTLGAGAIHLAAAPLHFDTVVLGGGFVAVGLAQVGLGALLLRVRSRRVVLVALAVHLLALGTLVASRTVGLPIGHAGAEAVGLADALTGFLELGATVVLGGHLAGIAPRSRRRDGLTVVVAMAWALSLGSAAAGVTALGTGGHDHGHGSAHDGSVAEEPRPSVGAPGREARTVVPAPTLDGPPTPFDTSPESTATPTGRGHGEDPDRAHDDDHEHPDGDGH